MDKIVWVEGMQNPSQCALFVLDSFCGIRQAGNLMAHMISTGFYLRYVMHSRQSAGNGMDVNNWN